MIHKFCFSLVILYATLLFGQGTNQKPCKQPEARQFDFWIGEWEATWKSEEGKIKKGRNKVSAILNGCVIFEEFDGQPGNKLIGKSVSVYDARSRKWKQTWVDNSGGYLDFTGGFQDNKMVLSREFQTAEGSRIQRMIWYNISEQQFDWNWEISDDNGVTWRIAWQIHYTRL